MAEQYSKVELFESVPVPKALATLAIPAVISQLVHLIYNMVDAFFIGRTGNSYMVASTTLSFALTFLNLAFANLFGVGGGSLIARLMGRKDYEQAKAVSSFSLYGAACIAVVYSILVGLFLDPILTFLGASADTLPFARQYSFYVIVLGSLPGVLSLTLAFLLRNAGYSKEASLGLSGGGILNMALDPLFMFVLLPKGMEVAGAAIATTLSNSIGCVYMLYAAHKASLTSPLSLNPKEAKKINSSSVKSLFAVGIPSALLTGLTDLASITLNRLSSAHSDFVLAGLGLVMKVERIPNSINVGICQGMLPIVAYNYSSGNHDRMKKTINTARMCGLAVSIAGIVLFSVFARQIVGIFLSTSAGEATGAAITIGYAATFLRIRCLSAPFGFLNYSSSTTMQAMGNGKFTTIHAVVKVLCIYIPMMILLDKLFGETGLAAAFPISEVLSSSFALLLLHITIKRARENHML